MKRPLLFIVCVLASVLVQAQEKENDYLPFVEDGKSWSVVSSDYGEGYHFHFFRLANEEVAKDGKTYMKMYRTEDDLNVIYDAGLLREEDRKVYFFDDDMQKEFLMFDYSLEAGDTFETYSRDEQKMVTYKVLSVGKLVEGPEVIRYNPSEKADSMTTHRYLRKWTVCRTDDNSLQKTWVEGVGSVEGPLANLYDARPVSSVSCLAYVECGDDYLPFAFHDGFGQTHGSDMPTGEKAPSDDRLHQLTYELEGKRLHVYGKVFTQCGPNNYAYFLEKPTADPSVRKIEFEIREVEPLADCMSLQATNFYVPGFDPNISYIVVDNQGVEHPVVNKTPQMAYRPFVEDGKVWKVGAFGSGNPAKWVECFCFDGDTIIDGRPCKKMMRQQYVSPDYEYYDLIVPRDTLSYVGAWYEEKQKVYTFNATSRQSRLMYDFSFEINDTLQIDGIPYLAGERQAGGISGFKGVYRNVRLVNDSGRIVWSTPWLEGVGGIYGPTINVVDSELADPAWFLISCTIGDEIIYLDDEYEDGATPKVMNARKRFDFTHTIKIKPNSREKIKALEKPLYGDYNNVQLDIYLTPLDDAYQVSITDETGKVVYGKVVNTGSIVGLNIDISSYTKGLYTVTVENEQEVFTGVFESQATGISDFSSLNDNEETSSRSIYNLQGQRVSSLRKGVNIVGRRKVYVK